MSTIDVSEVKITTIPGVAPDPDPEVVALRSEVDSLKAALQAKSVLTKADVSAIETAAAAAVEAI